MRTSIILGCIKISLLGLTLGGCGGGDGDSDGPTYPAWDFRLPELGSIPPIITDCPKDPAPVAAQLATFLSGAAKSSSGSFPLEPQGCLLVKLTVAGGARTLELGRADSTEQRIDLQKGGLTPPRPVGWTRLGILQEQGSTGSLQVDADADGKLDAKLTDSRAPGAFQQLLELYSPTGVLVASASTKQVSADVLHVVVRQIDAGGALAVVEEYDGPRLQEKCYPPWTPPTPPSQYSEIPCPGDIAQQINARISTDLAKLWGCLEQAGAAWLPVAATLRSPTITKIVCIQNGPWAAFPPDERVLYVDATRLPQAKAGLLAHEMLHGFLPGHNPATQAVLKGGGGVNKLASEIDQVYACEAYCFAPKPNRCHCARCHGAKRDGKPMRTCDAPCSWLPPCDHPELGRVYGQTATETFATCSSNNMFCDTMADCKAACGASCDNLSLNCDDNCN